MYQQPKYVPRPRDICDQYGDDIFMLERRAETARAETDAALAAVMGVRPQVLNQLQNIIRLSWRA